ncbi:hypothetical protein [Shewanella sp. SP2S2-6]|uniref:hypothetical protein n=1 Tax=Shewanella sp. SP2S2-6 TaxID=3063540 RepID=UPI00390CAAB5
MNNPLAGTDPTGYTSEEPELEEVKFTKETEKVAVTGSHLKREVTKSVSGTATYSNGATQSFSASYSNGKLSSASVGGMSSVGSLQQTAAKSGSSAKDAADNTGKMMTGASIVTAGLEQTKDLALLNTAGTGTALMATGSTGNAWALSKNAKSNLVATSLDGSKLASKLSPQVTLVGLLASGVSSAMDEDVTFTEAIVKSGVDASMALVGLRGGGVGTALSIGYSVVDVTYPGGWIQANKDANRGISQFSKEIDTHNIQKGWREDPVNTMKQIFGVPVIKL